MYSLRQYLLTLEDPHGLTRQLGEVTLCRDEQGRALFSAGNSAAVFRIRRAGRIEALRCYFRPRRHLAEIYGDRYLPRELYLYTAPDRGEWVDVVLNDWIEGETLQQAIETAAQAHDRKRLAALSTAFDHLAAELVSDNRAHGDLKPDNIIVEADGTLRIIDLDASFLPAFAGETSSETGTAAFQHPTRTAEDFDARIDDYPAALIATALHALRLDPTLYDRYGERDGLLFSPLRIGTDAALDEVLALLAQKGHAAEYRIARLLRTETLRLPGLPDLLHYLTTERKAPAAIPELFAENGLWGYRTGSEVVVPPLYDCGFDFTEGVAAVRLGSTWHYIDPTGRTVLSCPGYEAVKPFRNSRAQALRNGHKVQIDPMGREFEI